MNRNFVIVLLIGILAGVGVYFYNDYQYRQVHGQVIDVTLANWGDEVEDNKDKQPVLIYFRKGVEDPEQRKAVEKIAWRYAGKVKVVSLNSDRFENVVFALQFGIVRYPAFVVLYHGNEVHGISGSSSDVHELERLIERAQQKKTAPNP